MTAFTRRLSWQGRSDKDCRTGWCSYAYTGKQTMCCKRRCCSSFPAHSHFLLCHRETSSCMFDGRQQAGGPASQSPTPWAVPWLLLNGKVFTQCTLPLLAPSRLSLLHEKTWTGKARCLFIVLEILFVLHWPWPSTIPINTHYLPLLLEEIIQPTTQN